MNTEVATQRPVETTHSGPAASAIGARFLAQKDKALVIDIGGTTTDFAVLDHGQVNINEQGTTVGQYSTAVRGAHVRSIGLGGDSYIGFNPEGTLRIGPRRVTPISYLAHSNPRVAADLSHVWARLDRKQTPDFIEYWFLQREPRRHIGNEYTHAALDLLRKGPLALPVLLEKLGLYHMLQFSGQALINEEVVGRAALTPTDLLHVNGDHTPWDAQAARTAAEAIARLRDWPVERLVEEMFTTIAESIAAEAVRFVTGQSLERKPAYSKPDDLGLWLFEENLYGRSPYLGSRIELKMPLIGIGAPAAIFLPRVADILHTDLILPEHYHVANAIGAVAGSVMAYEEAWIVPAMKGVHHVVGYVVQARAERKRFSELEAALAYAHEITAASTLEQARRSGAVNPIVQHEVLPDGAETYRVRARAIGSPELG